MNSRFEFQFDERLGIQIPVQHHDWDEYTREEQEDVIHRWEAIRSRIPDRIKALEEIIEDRQLKISVEEDWDVVIALYEDVFTIASVINDLNNWMRLEPSTTYVEGHGLAEEHTSREKD
ncbi:hypothetical protein [Tumebacillus flagellatus]|uniref:Histidine kinase n=1 Tax=Tumebacillus flagellatus TaxID=1157490 RepID=A0A074LP27_9BACL|nr:hypothetical protein [Tumebacillus flagellatus]KEO83921.1 hypothetical protein EL26_06960 [Tumebacillus flagellatus]